MVVLDSTSVSNVNDEVCELLTECKKGKDSRVIVVCNKSDLGSRQVPSDGPWKIAHTSCLNSEGIDNLVCLFFFF